MSRWDQLMARMADLDEQSTYLREVDVPDALEERPNGDGLHRALLADFLSRIIINLRIARDLIIDGQEAEQ